MRIPRRRLAACSAALFLSLLLSGCFLANVQIWHEPGTAVFDPALVGPWNMKNCSGNDDVKGKYCAMVFVPHEGSSGYGDDRKDEKGYKIQFRGEKGQQSEYVAYLFTAGGERFLDTELTEGPEVDPAYVVHIIPVHLVWRVRFDGGDMVLEPLKLSWAADLARAGKLPPHVMLDKDTPLLDATPQQAVALLAQYAKDPSAFDNPLLWKKGAAPGAAVAKPAAKPPKK